MAVDCIGSHYVDLVPGRFMSLKQNKMTSDSLSASEIVDMIAYWKNVTTVNSAAISNCS